MNLKLASDTTTFLLHGMLTIAMTTLKLGVLPANHRIKVRPSFESRDDAGTLAGILIQDISSHLESGYSTQTLAAFG